MPRRATTARAPAVCSGEARPVGELERRGVPVEYIFFPDEGHGFRKLPNRITATVAIVRWFVEHLRITP